LKYRVAPRAASNVSGPTASRDNRIVFNDLSMSAASKTRPGPFNFKYSTSQLPSSGRGFHGDLFAEFYGGA
jgi:hypothetical protein